MTTSIGDLIHATRRQLMNGVAGDDTVNVLDGQYNAGDGSFTVKYPLNALQQGSRVSIGFTTFHVWQVSANTLTATVSAGVDGSPDMAWPAGTTVRVNPRWSDWEIFNELNNDLGDLSAPNNGLYQVQSQEITYNQVVRGYDLSGFTAGILGVLDVRYQTAGPSLAWPRLERYYLERTADLTNFPSGLALRLDSGATPGYKLQVLAKVGFTPWTITTTDVTTSGLPLTALDLPPLGAAIRLETGVDIERTRLDTQGDPRRADDVAVQAPGAAVAALKALRAQRIMAEKNRADSFYPPRRR